MFFTDFTHKKCCTFIKLWIYIIYPIKISRSIQKFNNQITANSMSSEEAKAKTQNTELVDVDCSPPAAALKVAHERT